MEKLTACPVCKNNGFSDFLTCKDYTASKESFNLVTCNACKFVFTNPRPKQEEIGRYLKNADEKEYLLIDKVTKSMMQKILKVPVVQLRAACQRDEAAEMIEVISDLFDLEKSKNEKE